MHPLILRIKKILFSSGFEPETFRVLGGCDNQLHHENAYEMQAAVDYICQKLLDNLAVLSLECTK